MIAQSSERVRHHTSSQSQRQIDRKMAMSLAYYRERPREIPQRLAELDREWDVERTLALNSSILSLLGLLRVLTGRPMWLIVPLVVQGFFLQHTLQGYCPPLVVLRKLGFRTPAEIDAERCALRQIGDEAQGDFDEEVGGSETSADAASSAAARI